MERGTSLEQDPMGRQMITNRHFILALSWIKQTNQLIDNGLLGKILVLLMNNPGEQNLVCLPLEFLMAGRQLRITEHDMFG